MRFGVGISTCREGKTYVQGYMQPTDFLRIAQASERLGFYSLWADDHLTTHRGLEAGSGPAPNYYEPITTFATLANVTTDLRFVFSVIIMPMREPVLLAKQISTLDVLTQGRVILCLGLGGSREELEIVRPDLSGYHRGTLLDEGIRAVRLLLTEPTASFDGTYVRFGEVEMAPKPAQNPFPIYINARESAALQRVGRLADGWLVSATAPARYAQAWAQVEVAAREHGRDPAQIQRSLQMWASIGRTSDEALERLRRSPHFRWLVYRQPDRSEAAALAKFKEGNLVGDPDEIIEQIRPYAEMGDIHLGIIFLNETVDELLENLELFASRVMPAFSRTPTLTV